MREHPSEPAWRVLHQTDAPAEARTLVVALQAMGFEARALHRRTGRELATSTPGWRPPETSVAGDPWPMPASLRTEAAAAGAGEADETVPPGPIDVECRPEDHEALREVVGEILAEQAELVSPGAAGATSRGFGPAKLVQAAAVVLLGVLLLTLLLTGRLPF